MQRCKKMSKDKKQSIEKSFDIVQELEFWNTFNDIKDADSLLLERFKKIRNEKIKKEEAQVIANNINRVIPEERKTLFFLRLFLELPKKECAISKELKDVIRNYCKNVLEGFGFDTTNINTIGKELCSSDNPDKLIIDFITATIKAINKTEFTKEDALAISYIWLVMSCKEYRIFEYWKAIIAIERVFVLHFRSEKDKDIKDCVSKSIPKAIANKMYEKQFLNISYLYTDYESKINELSEKKNSLKETVHNLISENKAQSETIASLSSKVAELESEIEKLQVECTTTKEELVLKDNMVKFEKNKFEQQFIGKEKNLMAEVENVIGLEIEGIEGIANRLPDKERERILRYIRRIKERITELGGQNNA